MEAIGSAYAAFECDPSTRHQLEATLMGFVHTHDAQPNVGSLIGRTLAIESILNLVDRADQGEFRAKYSYCMCLVS